MRRAFSTCAVVLICAIALVAYAAPTTKPSSPTTKPSSPRLFGAYEKMSSLTPEQRDKIHEIRRKYLADVHELEHKQTEDIAALLSDEQKKEFQEIEEKAAADAKAKAGAKKDPAPGDGER